MNPITWQLVKKDWDISKWPMVGYATLGAIALFLVSTATQVSFIIGSNLLITVLVVIGIHLIFVSVVHERSKQTLPFIMSLPITFMQYTRAKMIANLGVFGLAWLVIAIAVVAILTTNADLPNGMVPFSMIVMGELFAANVLILSVAIITESEAWTLVVMGACNVCIALFMFFIRSFEGISAHIEGSVAVWNSTTGIALGLEVLAIATFVALTFYAQSRKNDYL